MWSEWYRHLAEAGLPPGQGLPRDVWRFELAPTDVADLSSKQRLEAVGLPVPQPGRKTWRPYQRVGEQLADEGWHGLIAPCAARHESLVLCFFWHRDDSFPSWVTPVPPPAFIEDAPVVPTGLRT